VADTIQAFNHTALLLANKTIDYTQLYIELLSSSASFTASHTAKESVDTGSTATVTITIATPGVVTHTAHGFSNGQAVAFTTSGALPSGLASGTWYYLVNVATNTYQVSATLGGSAINTTGSQSGVHTAHYSGTKEVYGNGWAPGGVLLTTVAWSAAALDSGTTNDAKLTLDNVTVNATGGAIGPASFAVIWDKSTFKPLWFITFNSAQTAGSTTDFKFTWPANGIQTLTLSG
jgi:hypothetical protein